MWTSYTPVIWKLSQFAFPELPTGVRPLQHPKTKPDMKKLPSYRTVVSLGALLGALVPVPAAFGQAYLVNDQFDDLDRIGGLTGASTSSSSPSIGTPTATNTQWVSHRQNELVATGSGMTWTMSSASRMVIGYFPTFDVADYADGVTVNLGFTTGTAAGNNNFRIGLLDSSATGYRVTDHYNATDAAFAGDLGYAFFSNGSNVGSSTTNLSGNLVERTNAGSTDLMGTAGDWTAVEAGNKTGTGYLAGGGSYDFQLQLLLADGSLTITTTFTDRATSDVILSYTVTDSTPSTTTFDSIVVRLGSGSGQYDTLGLDYLTASAVPEPSTYAAIAGVLVLGLAVARRRRAAK